MKKSRAFTLIELLIVMMLTLFTLSMVGVSFPRLIKGEKFEGEVFRFVRLIDLAEAIMCTKHEDVTIICSPSDKGMSCDLKSSSCQHKIVLKEIDSITFNQQASPCELLFSANLGQSPIGEVELGNKQLCRYLTLPGYPSGTVIRNTSNPIGDLDETAYPQEIISSS